MKYILKNKDIIVLCFEISVLENTDRFGLVTYEHKLDNFFVINKDLLPLKLALLLGDSETETDKKENLIAWINSRKAPKNREFVDKIIQSYGGNEKTFMDYIDVSFGLSLNDSYWIVPTDKEYLWKDYNLYQNSFEKALELVAFTGASKKISGLTSSPEYTTNGMLRKCWHREDEKIYLYKGNSALYANGGKDAFSEYYCSQLADILNLNAIPYDLMEFHDQVVSKCPIFTSEDIGYVPIAYCFKKNNFIRNINEESEKQLAAVYGQEAFEDMMFFDGIIGNKDRHLGNFGMLIDNNRNRLFKAAPIFDNGASFLNMLTLDDFVHIKDVEKDYYTYFGYNPKNQMMKYLRERHLEGLEKLTTFSFERHHLDKFEKFTSHFEKIIQERADFALNLYYKTELKNRPSFSL